ncbi:MAG: hypothetical protein GY869_14805, partial [Planctomycetes bacterium]|nr:hypothetical protein [Planctomycetota bacterium]
MTLSRIADNFGTDVGAGNAADHGLTTTGAGYISYEIISQTAGFTVVVRFSASAATVDGILIGNANLIAGVATDGFCIWVDADGIKANYSDGVDIETPVEVDLDYADGEVHTVTYTVAKTSAHKLYVDALDLDTKAVTLTGTTGAATPVVVSGDGSNNFIGIIYKVRILGTVIRNIEHDSYHEGTLTSFIDNPLAVYRCDDFNNDTDGDRIWDRSVDMNDLFKADQATSSKYPTFLTTPTSYYLFDGVDDYVSNLMTLPTLFTTSGALSTLDYATGEDYPVIQQDTDTALIDDLTVEGDFTGVLHSLILYSGILNQLQLNH